MPPTTPTASPAENADPDASPTARQDAARGFSALILSSFIDLLDYPRGCASRFCRRHRSCRDDDTGNPPCLVLLHPTDHAYLTDLYSTAETILIGHCRPQCQADPEQQQMVEMALDVLYAILGHVPRYRARLDDWQTRYRSPPLPPIDTGALLADMKATLARDRLRFG